MKRTISIGVAALLFAAAGAFAQPAKPKEAFTYNPVSCFMGGELPVLEVELFQKGKIRAFFRHAQTTDWCSVDGENIGSVSFVTFPRFDAGDEIQYYFVMLDGKQIVGKSPQIYQVKATDHCETLTARHKIYPVVECLPPGASPIGQSLGTGYSLRSTTNGPNPPTISPDRPE